MIANVSPSSNSYDDTHNTLKYANRAKEIKSSVSIAVFLFCPFYSNSRIKCVDTWCLNVWILNIASSLYTYQSAEE